MKISAKDISLRNLEKAHAVNGRLMALELDEDSELREYLTREFLELTNSASAWRKVADQLEGDGTCVGL